MKEIMVWINSPFIWSGLCLLAGIIFARKKYQKWVAIAYLLVHCIEKAEASKVKEFVSRLAKGDLKKELDDVLEILGYKQRNVLSPSLSLAEIDKEHFFKKFPGLKPPKI